MAVSPNTITCTFSCGHCHICSLWHPPLADKFISTGNDGKVTNKTQALLEGGCALHGSRHRLRCQQSARRVRVPRDTEDAIPDAEEVALPGPVAAGESEFSGGPELVGERRGAGFVYHTLGALKIEEQSFEI